MMNDRPMRRLLALSLALSAVGAGAAPRPPKDATDTAKIRAFLDAGGSPDAVGGKVPLLCKAAFAKNLEAAKLLIERGADLNKAVETNGHTPVHCAISTMWADGVKLLVDAGARLDLPSTDAGT